MVNLTGKQEIIERLTDLLKEIRDENNEAMDALPFGYMHDKPDEFKELNDERLGLESFLEEVEETIDQIVI